MTSIERRRRPKDQGIRRLGRLLIKVTFPLGIVLSMLASPGAAIQNYLGVLDSSLFSDGMVLQGGSAIDGEPAPYVRVWGERAKSGEDVTVQFCNPCG